MPHRRSRGHNRRGAPMITDRYVLVVRQKRIVRPEDLPDICGVMNAYVEISVIADTRWKMHDALRCAVQQSAADPLDTLPVWPFRIEQLGGACTQSLPRRLP